MRRASVERDSAGPLRLEPLESRLLLSAALTGTIDISTLPNPLVPGDSASVRVLVTNQGDPAAVGRIAINLYASLDQSLTGALPLAVMADQSVSLTKGKSSTYTAKFTVPSSVPPGNYFFLADIDPLHVIPGDSPDNYIAASSQTRALVYQFGAVAGRAKATSLVVTDTDGSAATFSIKGKGTGQLTPNAGLFDLSLPDTDAGSAVRVSVKGGDGRFRLGSVTLASAQALTGAAVDLNGNLTATGTVGSLTLGDIFGGHTLEIEGSGAAWSLTAGAVTDLRIDSVNATIRSISVANWAKSVGAADWANRITAPSLVALKARGDRVRGLRGDWAAGLELSGAGVATSGKTLTGATVAGYVSDGIWSVLGSAGLISAGSAESSWKANFTGSLAGLKITGRFSGSVACQALGASRIAGNLDCARILIGANLGADAELGGSGNDSDTFGPGILTGLTVSGKVLSSTVAAGLDPVDGIVQNADDVIVGTTATSRINALSIAGTASSDSYFRAAYFPKTVSINKAAVNPLTGQRFGAPSAMEVSGVAADAILVGSQVDFYLINPDGSQGPSLGAGATTDAQGRYTVNLFPPPHAPFVAVAHGGSYVDEVTGATVNLAPGDAFRAVLPAGTQSAAITPLTDMAAARALYLASQGVPLADAIATANADVARLFGLVSVIGTLPVDASDATQVQLATLEQRDYGLILAGITQQAHDLGVRPIDLARALSDDLADGVFDGTDTDHGATQPIPLAADAGTVGLQNAISKFIASVRNQTNVQALTMNITASPIGINAAGLQPFVLTAALPAWVVDGRPHGFQLTASGGAGPYIWSANGLPAGFALSRNGVLTGTAPALAAGTTMAISPPFQVMVRDSAFHNRTIDLRITFVAQPPVVTTIVLTPAREGVPYAFQLQATGGTGIYYWYNSAIKGGFCPTWLHVGLDGTVSGTPPIGSGNTNYQFGVVAVDTAGNPSDPPVSLYVQATPGINVTPTSGLVTKESGSSASFSIALLSKPMANVTIPLESSAPGEGKLSRSSVVFTSANWNKPQTVTVTGVRNDSVGGDQTYTIITHPAVSTDTAYSGLDADDVQVLYKDDNVETWTGTMTGTTECSDMWMQDAQWSEDYTITFYLPGSLLSGKHVLGGTATASGTQSVLHQTSGSFYNDVGHILPSTVTNVPLTVTDARLYLDPSWWPPQGYITLSNLDQALLPDRESWNVTGEESSSSTEILMTVTFYDATTITGTWATNGSGNTTSGTFALHKA